MSTPNVRRMGAEDIVKARAGISSLSMANIRRMHNDADKLLKDCYKQTKYDLSDVTAISGSEEEKLNKVDELHALVSATTDMLSQAGLSEVLKSRLENRVAQGDGSLNASQIDKVVDGIMKGNFAGSANEDPSLFASVMGHDDFKPFLRNPSAGAYKVVLEGKEFLNAAMTTSAGVSAQSIRSGRMVDPVFGSWEIADLLPLITTDQQAYVWLEMASATELVEKAEGAAGVDLTTTGTQRSETLRRISGYQPVTEDQLQYVAGLEEFLNRVLALKLRVRLAKQLAVGDGVAPNLNGLFPRGAETPTAVQIKETAATGGNTSLLDDIIDADQRIVDSMGIIADGVAMSPITWGKIRKSKGNDMYFLGSKDAADAQPMRIFGKRIAQSSFAPSAVVSGIAQREAIVGNFTMGAALVAQDSIEVVQGMISDDFVKHQLAFRVSGKFQIAVFYTKAFEIITTINDTTPEPVSKD